MSAPATSPDPACEPEFGPREQAAAIRLIDWALAEDLDERGDVTSQLLIAPEQRGTVAIVARQQGVISGLPIARLVLDWLDPTCSVEQQVCDGAAVEPGQITATLTGSLRSLLTVERTILNFLTHLSGIATLTAAYVAQVSGTAAKILDTRKTHPGYRLLEKYAVRCGGGMNHRLGLYDGVMIKDNHLAARAAGFPAEPLPRVIELIRQRCPELPLTVEVDSLDQFRQLLPARPDIVLLDNMTPAQQTEAVQLRNAAGSAVLLEASGGVTLQTVRNIALTGVDRISVGALTHSAPACDLAFDWHHGG